MKNNFFIFSGNSNLPLAREIAQELNTKLAPVTIKKFSDDEIWVKYETSLRGKDVFIIQSTTNDHALLELFFLLDAAKRAKAGRRIAVMPYFGYARQDRKDQPRVSVGADLVCQLLETAGATNLILSELHNPAITNSFRPNNPDHLYLTQKLWPTFKNIPNLTVMSTDAGGAKMARYYAEKLKAERVTSDKIRGGHNVVTEVRIIGDVKGKNILLVDDIADTGGSLEATKKAAQKLGALDFYIAAVHAVLSGDGIKRIASDSDIKKVVVTNTINKSDMHLPAKIKIVPISDVFAKAIDHFHFNKSIDSLFDQNSI